MTNNNPLLPYHHGREPNKPKDLQTALDYGAVYGMNKLEVEDFYYHYEAQCWYFGNGLPIGNWQAAMIRWQRTHERKKRENGQDGKTKAQQAMED